MQVHPLHPPNFPLLWAAAILSTAVAGVLTDFFGTDELLKIF